MRTRIITIISVLSFFSHIYAQQFDNGVIINNTVARQVGNTLFVEMDIDARNAVLSSNQKVVLTPVIKSGEQILELSPVTVSGTGRYKADRRASYFKNKETDLTGTYKINESSDIHYNRNISFEPWMGNAVLAVKQEIYGCATCKDGDELSVIKNSIDREKPNAKFVVEYIVPQTESTKKRDHSEGSTHLYFRTGQSIIVSGFDNNENGLNKIDKVLGQSTNDKNATITSIDLRGYASPEGSSASNTRLSLARANAMKDYLQKKYSYDTNLFNVSSGGEDWSGLEKQVRESDLTDKGELLDIITSSVSEDAREQKLKAYSNSYKTVFNRYYPALRRVDYQANYAVRDFNAREAREVVKTHPEKLSLKEMYQVANTYQKGSKEYNDILNTAARLFPNDATANINAAAVNLEIGDASSARRYLQKYAQTPESWNNMGVLYALEGDLNKAKEFWLKAKERGSSEANANLAKLKSLGY